MAHEFVKGFFSNNEPAWHSLGTVLPDGVWPGRSPSGTRPTGETTSSERRTSSAGRGPSSRSIRSWLRS